MKLYIVEQFVSIKGEQSMEKEQEGKVCSTLYKW
jgi:hypothetical protein